MAKLIQFQIKIGLEGKETLTAATHEVKKMGKGFDDARGAAKKMSERLMDLSNVTNIISNVTSALGQLNERISAVSTEMAKTSQLTGLQGEEMTALRSRVKALCSVYGEEYTSILSAANNMSKAFGISAEEALSLVQKGFAAGANSGGDFIDTLKEYPRYFKEAGISAEEFVAIQTNAAKQGIFSDKGVDAIKEGNLRIREMTKATAEALDGIGISSDKVKQKLEEGSITTFQVMQAVGNKLKELPASSAAVGTAIADIFGGPGEDAGLEYLKSLGDIELSMDALVSATDEYSKAQDALVESTTNTNDTFSFMDTLMQKLSVVQPFTGLITSAGMAIMVLGSAVSALKTLHVTTLLATVSTKAFAAAKSAFSFIITRVRTAIVSYTMAAQVMTKAELAGAIATNVLKVAIKGLMICTGIGAVIAALTSAIEFFANKASDASDAADGLSGSAEELSTTQERHLRIERNAGEAIAAQLATIRRLTEVIHDNNAAQKDRVTAINKLRSIIPDYTAQLSSEGNVIKENTASIDNYIRKLRQMARAKASQDMLVEVEGNSIDLEAQKTGWQSGLNLYRGHLEKAKKRFSEASDNYRGGNKLEDNSGQISASEMEYEAAKKEVERLQKEVDKRVAAIAKIDKALAENERTAADLADYANKNKIDLPDLGGGQEPPKTTPVKVTTQKAYVPVGIENLDTIKGLEDEIKYYRDLQQTQTKDEVADTQKTINALEAKRDAIQAVIDAAKPKAEVKVEVKTPVEQLRESLKEAEEALENATDVKAKVVAAAKVAELQEQINTATNGRVSIKAPVEASYILRGSTEDKRQSYSNAQSRADRIQSDYSIGLIDKKEAERQLAEVNKALADFDPKLKPIKLEFDESGFKKFTDGFGKFKGVTGNIDSVKSSIETLTSSIEEGADAWTIFSNAVSIVGNVLELTQSVIDIVNTLTEKHRERTQAATAAKNQENAAIVTGTAATIADTAAKTTETAVTDVNTASAQTNAVAKGGEAIASATASGASMPFPYNIIAIATGVAAVVAALATTIGSFATGGVVGGSSPSGDRLLARVNSGEMILNMDQQRRLFNFINSATAVNVPTQSAPNVVLPLDRLRQGLATADGTNAGQVEFKIKGRNLRGVLRRQDRLSARS